MNDIKVTVNFGTFVVVMIVWIVLFGILTTQSINMPQYKMPEVLMNLFMLITGSVMTIFQGFEKGVTFKSSIESTSTATTTTTTEPPKGDPPNEKTSDTPDPAVGA